MIDHIQNHTKPFAMIDKACLEDVRLSWKARGILVYLLSKPGDWEVRSADLIAKSEHDGRAAVRFAMKGLVKCGYAKLQPNQSEGGRWDGQGYNISEIPRDISTNHLRAMSYSDYLKTDHWQAVRKSSIRYSL